MDIEKFQKEHQKMIDGHGGYTAVRMQLMGQKVYASLYFRTSLDEETISFARGSDILNFGYIVDLYTETGIKKLKIPSHSCFELKDRLVSDSVSRIIKFAERYHVKYPGAKVYLIYNERGMLTEQVEKEVKKRKFVEVWQIDDFISWTDKFAQIQSRIEFVESEWKTARDLALDTARLAFLENQCSFFLGAGVSIDAGGPSWEVLLRKIMLHYKQVGKKDFFKVYTSCGQSPIILGRYVLSKEKTLQDLPYYLQRYVLYRNVNPEQSELIKAICEAVKTQTGNSSIVASSRVDSIITYNYDDLVETALEQSGVRVARVYLKSRNQRDEFPVYHVHGLIPQKNKNIASTLILGEKEYHEVYRETYNWSNVEQLHALDRNTCFFIGLSMTDPNLRRLLDISHSGGDNDSRHFAFLKREPLFKGDIEKNKNHFSTVENQFFDLGVRIIWYERYDEVPKMLRKIIAPWPTR